MKEVNDDYHSCPWQKVNSDLDLQSVDTCLGSAVFTHSKVALWQATIVENALKRLAALNKPFKYVGEHCIFCAEPRAL